MEPRLISILFGTVVAGLIAAGFFIFVLYRRWTALFGKTATREDGLAKILKEHSEFKKTLTDHEIRLQSMEAIGSISIQKVGFIRFNPFSETGGDNSFALTLLDHKNNGVIISSLYAREGVRVYGKSVEAGISKRLLSEEEKKSLECALKT